MRARILNNSSYGDIWTNEFLTINKDLLINGQLVSEWELTDILPNEAELKYYSLKWNGINWFEYATSEEISIVKNQHYNEKLQFAVSDLRIRAKGLSIGKTGSNSYILAQVDFYQRKYENAVSQNPVPEIDSDLEAEGLRDFGLILQDFKALIISMYMSGKENENYLMCFIEQGRSAILTLMANEDWVNVDLAFELIDNLKGITTVAEARIIKNQILEL